jgi:hypothetical protein
MSEDNKTTIYRLTDPRNGRPFYVGKTINGPRRLDEHLRDAARHPKTERAQVIAHLAQNGFTPGMESIDGVPHTEASAAERAHIAGHGARGWVLTNILMNRGSRSDLDLSRLVRDPWLDPLQLAERLSDVAAAAGVRAQSAGERVRDAASASGRGAGAVVRIAGRMTKSVWEDPAIQTGVKAGAAVIGQHVAVRLIKALTEKR